MFVAVSPFLDRFIMFNFSSMVIAFHFFDALPAGETCLHFGVIMKGKMFTQSQKELRHNAQAHNQNGVGLSLGDAVFLTHHRRSAYSSATCNELVR